MRSRSILVGLALTAFRSVLTQAEDDAYYQAAAANDDGAAAADDGAAANDDAGNGYYGVADDGANNAYSANQYATDGINYWTNYALKPLSCITQNNVDVITFQFYEQGYKQCLNTAMGTYFLDVPSYVSSYLTQAEDNAENEGIEFTAPSSAQYVSCTEYVLSNGDVYYMQIGCNDYNKEKLAVNIYTDSSCTKRSTVKGSDDSIIDVSGLRIKFGECQGCVVWFDKTDDAIDDNYWKNHKNQAPLCHNLYEQKATCTGSCYKSARVVHLYQWTGSEKLVLVIVYCFLVAAVANILKIKYLQNKDQLLSTAETDEDLNKEVAIDPKFKWGLIGAVALVGLLGAVTIAFKAKKATWLLLFATSAALFLYLMKLTLETGYKPCGDTHYEDESDDDDEDDGLAEKGDYKAPLSPVSDAGEASEPASDTLKASEGTMA